MSNIVYWSVKMLCNLSNIFADVKDSDRKSLFKKKLQQCCVIFNFGVEMSTQKRDAKEAKMCALSEILEYLIHGKNVLTEDLYPEITKMVWYCSWKFVLEWC